MQSQKKKKKDSVDQSNGVETMAGKVTNGQTLQTSGGIDEVDIGVGVCTVCVCACMSGVGVCNWVNACKISSTKHRHHSSINTN